MRHTAPSPFRYFNSSPEVIRLVVMMYIRYPLSLRNVEDLFFERGIDISHETVRLWWNRFGPLFASEIRRQRVSAMRGLRQSIVTRQGRASVPARRAAARHTPSSAVLENHARTSPHTTNKH
jgi:hypothetical protein